MVTKRSHGVTAVILRGSSRHKGLMPQSPRPTPELHSQPLEPQGNWRVSPGREEGIKREAINGRCARGRQLGGGHRGTQRHF